MNINYKVLSEQIYSEINSDKSKWKDKDLSIIMKIGTHIKNEVAKVKRADKYQDKIKSEQDKPIVNDTTGEIYINGSKDLPYSKEYLKPIINTDTIQQQLYEIQDKKENRDIMIQNLNDEIKELKSQLKSGVIKPEIQKNESGIKRYQVNVRINSGFKVNPKFQVFQKSVEELKDNVGNIKGVFHNYEFYIDSDDEKKIKQHMTEIFEPGQMYIETLKVDDNFIPRQYITIWRNQTTM